MYRQLLHTADISPFDIIVLFFWQAQWARSIISAVLFLFHWVHTLTMVTFLNGSTCALPILYNNLQPILTSVTTSWCDIMCIVLGSFSFVDLVFWLFSISFPSRYFLSHDASEPVYSFCVCRFRISATSSCPVFFVFPRPMFSPQ